MRFVHMSDIHFDSPFTILSNRKDLGIARRMEQRGVFRKAIEYISKEKIPYLFIAGDLYEQKYIRESTIEFINNLFKTIPYTKIFISPGNHDPFLQNSFYNTFNWNNNVTIFHDKLERIELEDIDIYGYGFSDFYCYNSGVEEIKIKNNDKINILVIHGALDSSKNIDVQYNPMSTSKLKDIGFDYIALGHIHKKTSENKYNFIYPGSLISFGFDELGEHGILDVKIEKNNYLINCGNNRNNKLENKNLINKNNKNELNNKNNIKIKFIKLDNTNFEEIFLNISEENSEEDILENFYKMKLEENKFYKLILKGIRKTDLDISKIFNIMYTNRILKIENQTKINSDFDRLAKQNNLKGIFVKILLMRLKENPENQYEVKKALEIGLKAFE